MAGKGVCSICGIYSNLLFSHEKWCFKKRNFLDKYSLTKEKIESELKILGSILEFKKKYPGLSQSQYYKIKNELKIDWSLKDSCLRQKRKEKYKETCLKNWGTEHNFSKKCKNRIEWEKRLLKEEGITNVFQREEVKQKSLKTIIEKYGSNSNRAKYCNRGISTSSLNKKLFRILNELEIKFIPEFPIKKNSKGIYYFDALILDTKKIIEINGDYWHGNPIIYKPNDLILKGSKRGEIKVSKKWEKDKIKIERAIENGYEVLTIWELEINTDIDKVISGIKEYAKN